MSPLTSTVVRTVALIALFASLAGGYFGVRFGLADYHSQQGYDVMASWTVDNPVTEESWQSAYDLIEYARDLAPTNPTYPQRLARLHRMKVTHDLVKGVERDVALQKAIQHLEASLGIRPYWPMAWRDLTYVYWLSGATDEYEAALENAVRYGPWEPYVIRLVVFLGRADQAYLFSRGYDELVLDAYVRGLRSSFKGLSDDILLRLKSHENVQARVLERMTPYLVAPWPRGKSYDYFGFVDWAWAEFDSELKDDVMARVVVSINTYSTPRYWVSRVTNDEFLGRVCEAFTEEGKGEGLERWCE